MAESLNDLKTRKDIASALKQELQEQKQFLEEQGFLASKLLGITKDATVINDKLVAKESLKRDITNDQAKTALKTIRANKEIAGSIMSQLGFLKKFKSISSAINLILAANPILAIAGIVTALVVGFLKLQKAVAETRKELGLSTFEAGKLEARFFGLGIAAKGLGLSSEDIRGSFEAIRTNFGGIDEASNGFIMNLASAQLSIGATSDQIAKVLSLQESVSDASRETLLSQLEAEAATIRLAGVAPGAIFRDIAENSEFFASTMKDGGKNVMAAAVGARKLGLNLSSVTQIADNLLDFESSIEAQMEASVMLGRQLNLDRARQLSYLDDTEGMMKEILKQVGGEAEFSKMLRVERQVLAKAVGTDVETLARLVRARETGGKMEATKSAMSAYENASTKASGKTNDILGNIEKNTKGFIGALID
jgi:hypothetical protein